MVYVNDVPFGDKSFPNGETIFNTCDLYIRDANNEVSLVYESDSDIFKLIVAKRCLDKEITRGKVKHSFFNKYKTPRLTATTVTYLILTTARAYINPSILFTGITFGIFNNWLNAKIRYQCTKNIEKLYFAIKSIALLNDAQFFIGLS